MQLSHRCASSRVAAKSTTPNNFQKLAGLLYGVTSPQWVNSCMLYRSNNHLIFTITTGISIIYTGKDGGFIQTCLCSVCSCGDITSRWAGRRLSRPAQWWDVTGDSGHCGPAAQRPAPLCGTSTLQHGRQRLPLYVGAIWSPGAMLPDEIR